MGRHSVSEPLQLTLKLAQAKCQLNIDIVAEKYQAGSTSISERLQVYSTVSIYHLKKMISQDLANPFAGSKTVLHVYYKKKELQDNTFLFEAFRI